MSEITEECLAENKPAAELEVSVLRCLKADMDRGGWRECCRFLGYFLTHFDEICDAIDARRRR